MKFPRLHRSPLSSLCCSLRAKSVLYVLRPRRLVRHKYVGGPIGFRPSPGACVWVCSMRALGACDKHQYEYHIGT